MVGSEVRRKLVNDTLFEWGKWRTYANEAEVVFVSPAPLVVSLVWHVCRHDGVCV